MSTVVKDSGRRRQCPNCKKLHLEPGKGLICRCGRAFDGTEERVIDTHGGGSNILQVAMILAGIQFLLVLFAGTYFLVAEFRWWGIIPVIVTLLQTAAWIIVLREVNKIIADRQERAFSEHPTSQYQEAAELTSQR